MQQPTPSNNLFIGDLPEGITKEMLEKVFAAYGQIQDCRVLGGKSGKASGMVRYETVDEAQFVVDTVNGQVPDGLSAPVVVRFANSGNKGNVVGGGMVNPAAMGKGAGGFVIPTAGGAANTATDNLWIGDLPASITKEELEQIFARYGEISSCRVMPAKPGGNASAMVRYTSVDDAKQVVDTLNGFILDGLESPVIIKYANGSQSAAATGKGGVAVALPSVAVAKPAADNLWIGDLPSDMTKELLEQIFCSFGEIQDCRVTPGTNGRKASAMVRYGSTEAAQFVVDTLNGQIPDGLEAPVIVRFANTPNKGKAAGGVVMQAAMGKGGGMVNLAVKGAMTNPAIRPAGMGVVTPAGGMVNPAAMGKGAGVIAVKGGAMVNPAVKGAATKKVGTASSFKAIMDAAKETGAHSSTHTTADCQIYVKNLPADTKDVDLYRLFAPFGAIAPTGCKAMIHPDGTCKGIGFVNFAEAHTVDTAIEALNGLATPCGGSLVVTKKTVD